MQSIPPYRRYCTQCGQALGAVDLFCGGCGHTVPTSPTGVVQAATTSAPAVQTFAAGVPITAPTTGATTTFDVGMGRGRSTVWTTPPPRPGQRAAPQEKHQAKISYDGLNQPPAARTGGAMFALLGSLAAVVGTLGPWAVLDRKEKWVQSAVNDSIGYGFETKWGIPALVAAIIATLLVFFLLAFPRSGWLAFLVMLSAGTTGGIAIYTYWVVESALQELAELDLQFFTFGWGIKTAIAGGVVSTLGAFAQWIRNARL